MAVLKQRLHQKNSTGTYDTVHWETEAGLVLMADGSTVQSTLGNHVANRNNPHSVTAAQIGAAKTKTLTVTVPVSWTASGAFYYQNISVPGMLATDNPVADILPGSDNAANKLYAENWGKVQSIDTLNGAVKIWCTAAPTTAFPVQFKAVA